jgi:hypothetical protein
MRFLYLPTHMDLTDILPNCPPPKKVKSASSIKPGISLGTSCRLPVFLLVHCDFLSDCG